MPGHSLGHLMRGGFMGVAFHTHLTDRHYLIDNVAEPRIEQMHRVSISGSALNAFAGKDRMRSKKFLHPGRDGEIIMHTGLWR
jgi:hypothetical protein